jgi:hypothetical protein
MTSVNRRTSRVQGRGGTTIRLLECPVGRRDNVKKVAGGEIRCGVAPIWWKNCIGEGSFGDAVRQRSTGGGRDGVKNLGKR